MATTKAYVCKEAGFALTLEEVPLPECGSNDVVVKIDSCGLCHSDLNMMDNSWGLTQFPMVAGHEGIGKITKVGDNVKNRKVGDLVGIGWMRNSCGGCGTCAKGWQNQCSDMMGEAIGPMMRQNGCFAEDCVIPAAFATPIPSGIDSVGAAPLMCAGITVWNPLVTHATSLSKVGVNAVGGLGHLAIQFAAKMGCEVVGMSRGPAKKDAALGFGAKSFIDTKDAEQMKAAAGSFDLILDTAPATGDMDAFLPLLAAGGKYHTVGAPADGKKMEIGNFVILPGSQSVGASGFGSLAQLRDMMIFAARHGIVADYEKVPFSKLTEACEKLQSGKGEKMRVVLVRD